MEDCGATYCFQSKQQCAAFTDLPNCVMRLKSLHVLNLSGCEVLNTLPESVGALALLQELLLAGSALQRLPSTISCFQELRILNLRDCAGLTTLPQSLGSLVGLRELDLGGVHLFASVCLCALVCSCVGLHTSSRSVLASTRHHDLSLALSTTCSCVGIHTPS